MYHFKRATQPLSTQEKIIQNRYRQQESQSRNILDADHHKHLASAMKENGANNEPLADSAFCQHWALFEWSQAKPEYLSQARSVSFLNSREEQGQFLASSSDEAIYILVNAEQSPDRGTRRFFSRVSMAYPSLVMVISGDDNAKFIEDWQRLARETHLNSTQLKQKD
jgi:hypothetical protein